MKSSNNVPSRSGLALSLASEARSSLRLWGSLRKVRLTCGMAA